MSALTLNVNLLSNAIAQEYDKYGENYSTYPTDDKKYECRTGPFEGFFVGSVEFCKFKFIDKVDRDRDNSTGTHGPSGPQGIQGIQGPIGPNGTQGPEGQSVLNSSRFYDLFSPVVNSSSSGVTATAFVFCDTGDSATGGGFLKAGDNLDIFVSAPNNDGESGWTVGAIVSPPGPFALAATVQCFDNPPAHIP